MKINIQALACVATIIIGSSCSKNNKDVLPPPVVSSGATMTLNGGEGGSAAQNTVFVDFSTGKQDSVKRNSWDLGFYSGSDFKVIINNTNGASIKKIAKTDLNLITEADFNVSDLTLNLGSTDASEFAKIDDPRESNILNKTAIGTISAADADNKAFIIIPSGGTHSSVVSSDNAYKIRILRKNSGYTLQYAKLQDLTYKTIDISKNSNYNFNYFSLSQEKVATIEPVKSNWDIEWTWSIYYDPKAGYIYSYSDIIFTNSLGNVTSLERVYANPTIAADAFDKFSKDSIAKYSLLNQRDVIGAKWRNTTGTVGVLKDRFYLIKDVTGNYYKIRFLNFIAADGGVRGKPILEYKLIN